MSCPIAWTIQRAWPRWAAVCDAFGVTLEEDTLPELHRTMAAVVAEMDRRGDLADIAIAASSLAEEVALFESMLPRWLAEGSAMRGRFVLIKASQVIGIFAEREAALEEGYRRYPLEGFFVREVAEHKPIFVPG